MADVIATVSLFQFEFYVGEHHPKCEGRWYLPVFLLRDGLLTLMNIDSFIISSLLHRAKHLCSSKQLLDEEESKIQRALSQCKYPDWAINRTRLKINTPKPNNRNNSNKTISRGHITVSYSEGLSESVKNICKKYGIEVHLKSGKSIKDELVAPKDQDHLTKKSGIIYKYKCDRLECDEEYIGETA